MAAWFLWVVPVYLFKRPSVAGGGYGYAVLWLITFFIVLFMPALNISSPSLTGSPEPTYIGNLFAMRDGNELVVRFSLYYENQDTIAADGTALISIPNGSGVDANSETKTIDRNGFGLYSVPITQQIYTAFETRLNYDSSIRQTVANDPTVSVEFSTDRAIFETIETAILNLNVGGE